MALAFAHGAIQWLAADAATTVYTVSGLSFQPKALRFYWQGLGSATDTASEATHGRRGVGFAASTSNRACTATQDQDAAGSAVCTAGIFTDAIASTVTSTPARDGALDLNSITADGFTLIVDDQVPVNITVFWEAWGGTDITDAAVNNSTEPGATGIVGYVTGNGNQSGANFQPSVVMLSSTQNTSLETAARLDSGFCVGAGTRALASADQGASVMVVGNSDDGSATMDTDGQCLSGLCLSMIPPAGGASPNMRARLADSPPFTATGFRLDWLERASTRRFIFLSIAGGDWQAGGYTIAGNTLNATTTVSALRSQPVGICLMERGAVSDGIDAATVDDVVCLGTGSSTSSRRSQGYRSENGTGNAEIDLAIEYDQVLVVPSTAGAVLSAFDVNAINADGFQIIVDVAGGVANEFHGYLAFGDTPAGHIFKLAGDGGGLAGPMRGLAG